MDAPHLRLASAPTDSRSRERPRSPIGVILADDHAQMRRSLRLLLDGEKDIEVIAEADDLSSVLRHLRRHRPPVVVLGLGMEDGSLGQAIGQLRTRAPATQIVALTMDENPVLAQRALAAGGTHGKVVIEIT